MSKDILQKIEDKYTTGSDWVVEKGKVAEAKIIKECYLKIRELKKDRTKWLDRYESESMLKRSLERENVDLINRAKTLEQRIENMKEEIIKSLKWL